MLHHLPKQLFRQLRVALPIRMGESVLTGWGRTPHSRQWTGVQPQRIANVVEAEAVSQLRIEQTDRMTPRTEGARPIRNSRLPRQMRDEMVGNQIAKLAQKRELTGRWLVSCLIIHTLPCGRAQTRKPTFSYTKINNPVGLQ